MLEKLNLAVVGVRRGIAFKSAVDAHPQVRVHAVCDIDAERLAAAQVEFGAAETYAEYEEMLAHADIDAVIVATPMYLHAAQAAAALKQDLHVLSEVTAAVSLEECRDLVAAATASKGTYMLAENCNYFRTNALVRELVRQGLFGTTYFGEGEYLHRNRTGGEATPWRRHWQLGIDGITYGTHGLGPVLSWMPGDRIAAVTCAGSGHHHVDIRGKPFHQDTSIMLGRMRSGGLVKVRVDMISKRPAVTTTFQLQGTRGCFESARDRAGRHRIWLEDRCPDENTWLQAADLEEEFLPEYWRRADEAARQSGHDGGDHFVAAHFLDAVLEGRPPEIGIHEAMDMTTPTLVSQLSIAAEGRWMEVPDSRDW